MFLVLDIFCFSLSEVPSLRHSCLLWVAPSICALCIFPCQHLAPSHAQASGESQWPWSRLGTGPPECLKWLWVGMWSAIEGEVCAECSTSWGGNKWDQSGSLGGGPGGGTKVVPKVEKPFIYAVDLASRKLWSRPWTPTLVPHFGRPLGGPRGASISSRVPEIAQFCLNRFPPSGSPSFKEDKAGLVAIKVVSSPWGHEAMVILTVQILDGKHRAGHHTFTPMSGMRLTSQRHLFV